VNTAPRRPLLFRLYFLVVLAAAAALAELGDGDLRRVGVGLDRAVELLRGRDLGRGEDLHVVAEVRVELVELSLETRGALDVLLVRLDLLFELVVLLRDDLELVLRLGHEVDHHAREGDEDRNGDERVPQILRHGSAPLTAPAR
jgi:hypothetical protein